MLNKIHLFEEIAGHYIIMDLVSRIRDLNTN